MEPNHPHIPVLGQALFDQINLEAGSVAVDATVGYGGHAVECVRRIGPSGVFLGLDVDEQALERTGQRLGDAECRICLVRENFSRLGEVMDQQGVGKADFILADLGVNSAQLDQAERGFSFQQDGPLDMRMDDRIERTAADLVNSLEQEELANVIFRYGEERLSRRVARTLVESRRRERIVRTGQLSELVLQAMGLRSGGRRGRIHPATRTFQALRIAVNDELRHLESFLQQVPDRLNPEGKIAVISFHSLEDRIVKLDFRHHKKQGSYHILTKKPLIADEQERRHNPRSRSAKMRIAQRF